MSSAAGWISDPVVARQLEGVEQLLGDAARLGGDCPPFHTQLLSPRRKRLRSALLLLAGRFGPAGPEPALLAAASGIELLHEATLYHDDIVDEATTRRGRPSVQRACGAATAAFAGTELLFATGELFAELPPRLRRAIGRAGHRLCCGQLRELELLGDLGASERVRMRVMRDKTAILFALAGRLGAGLSGAADAVERQLIRFGTRFGLCFQLADDLRDLIGPAAVLGRRLGADLRDGVYSLPVIYGLRRPGSDAQRLRACLLRLQSDPNETLVARALALLARSGGIAKAQIILASWIMAARSDIDTLPTIAGIWPQQSLHALLDQLPIGAENTARSDLRADSAPTDSGTMSDV